MVQLGPNYDLAQRLKRVEDYIARQQQNPIGQAFSATQSDGSIGLQISQTTNGAGATALVVYQGPQTARDPSTGQHPMLLWLGQLWVNGAPSDNGAIFFRPDGTESVIIGDRGVQIVDKGGKTVVSSDENSGEGLATPWIELGQPTSSHFSHWPYTNSGTSALIAEKFFQAQHPKIYWNASVAGDPGVSGTVQATITVNGQTVQSGSYSYSGSQVNISELITLPQPFFGHAATFAINGSLSGGSGNLYCATWQLTSRQS